MKQQVTNSAQIQSAASPAFRRHFSRTRESMFEVSAHMRRLYAPVRAFSWFGDAGRSLNLIVQLFLLK
ncbi:hypothetical protein ACIRU8_44195, partial [Streptomyces sp. NPDC101175]|uniref:hypothetical protein n=1 Tax=Streptomyces sp. NPDC101175 TaxID=3366123 RepID=UPI003838E0E1